MGEGWGEGKSEGLFIVFLIFNNNVIPRIFVENYRGMTIINKFWKYYNNNKPN